ncbi:MAG TPA: FoF1 ATP synthase subunit gamma [Candidatus Omnitrophota bacterium]|nr:FoF1 ATP synthase subunit gamma [Candidatus Omnitrophota bacterium]
MKTIQHLKEELELNGDLTELMDVLKGIAVSEFWALSKKMGRFARFMREFEGFFAMLDFSSSEHAFAKEQGALGIIMVTSNEGFMGGLNSQVINTALHHEGADEAELMIVGEQGAIYLESLGRKFVGFPGVATGECYEAALRLKNYIMEQGRAGRFGRLVFYYPKPLSFMVQKIEELKLLPCTKLFEERPQAIQPKVRPIVESSMNDIVEYLVETWIVQKVFEALEDSKLAEFSARTVHLEESYQILLEQGKGIRHEYFRSHHELVDAGMRDIYSAQIVRKKGMKKKIKPCQ